MNGGSGNSAPRAALLLAFASVLAAVAGCARPQYDGKLRPEYSRLTVVNRTAWRCEVRVEPAEATSADPPCRIRSILSSDQQYTWDLPAGTYKLTASRLMPPRKSFSTIYQADPGKHRRWPLLDSTSLGD